MRYVTEQSGSETRVLLENGDTIIAKVVLGDIYPNGKNPDGSLTYFVQHHVAVFVAGKDATAKTLNEKGK